MDNSLKQIIQSGLANLFGSSNTSDSVIGIDIGSSSIKVVQLKKRKGQAVLETYGALSLGPYSKVEVGKSTNLPSDDIVKALLDTMKESNVTTKYGQMSIPTSSSLIFTISLPASLSEEELKKVVPMEARKYIPISVDEVTMDWFVIPREAESFEDDTSHSVVKNPESKVEILVVAIHNETLIKYQDILKKANIKSDSFELEIFSSIRSSFSHDVAPVLLMDFGASKTKLSIVESGIVRFFHVVNRGSQDISNNISASLGVSFEEAERLKRSCGLMEESNKEVSDIARLSIDYIFSETNNVVLAFEKKYNKNISKIVLSGGGSLLKGLLEYSNYNFNTQVIHSDPFAKVEAPAFLEPVLKASGPEFSVAIGLALRQLS